MVEAKIPPQAVDVEEEVLGALLTDVDTLEVVFDKLSPNDFYNNSNRHIYESVKSLYKNQKSVDLLSLENYLKDKGLLSTVGGESYLIDLTRSVRSTANIEYYCQILIQKSLKRDVIRHCNEIIKSAYDPMSDGSEVMDDWSRRVDSVDKNTKKISALTPSEIFERDKNKPKAEKLYLGYSNVDHGIYAETNKRGQIEITIADSGHGKTQYALWKATQLQNQGHKIAWFQLEDYDSKTARQVEQKVRLEYLDNIFITDELYDIEDIKRELRMLNRKHGIDCAVFDYVQNIECSQNISRTEKVEYISKQLTRMAKDLNMYCHALSQVTISYDTRNGWKQEPGYGDVRWSQQLKQDAHIITSVFRPSQIESLCVKDKVIGWENGQTFPFNSVFVRQAKVRYGQKEWKRLHMINGEDGLKPYTPRDEAESILKQMENNPGF